MIKASEIIKEVVKRGVAPFLKQTGFKKDGLRFQRNLNDVCQIISVQLSHGNSAHMGSFFINVGLGFDTLWAVEPSGIPERPKVYECHSYKRIEQVILDTPASWEVSSFTDLDVLSEELADRMMLLVSELDRMSSIEAVLQGNWLQVGSERILKGRLFRAKGDFQSAISELRAAADFFADRGMSLDKLVESYNLDSLKPML